MVKNTPVEIGQDITKDDSSKSGRKKKAVTLTFDPDLLLSAQSYAADKRWKLNQFFEIAAQNYLEHGGVDNRPKLMEMSPCHREAFMRHFQYPLAKYVEESAKKGNSNVIIPDGIKETPNFDPETFDYTDPQKLRGLIASFNPYLLSKRLNVSEKEIYDLVLDPASDIGVLKSREEDIKGYAKENTPLVIIDDNLRGLMAGLDPYAFSFYLNWPEVNLFMVIMHAWYLPQKSWAKVNEVSKKMETEGKYQAIPPDLKIKLASRDIYDTADAMRWLEMRVALTLHYATKLSKREMTDLKKFLGMNE